MNVTPKRILIVIPLLAALGVAIGISIVTAQTTRPAEACAPSTHKHRYADIRLALVEIEERDQCGFRFKNLEQPISDRVEFSADFAGHEVDPTDVDHATVIPRSALHSGLRCVIAYCRSCKAVLSLKTWRNR